MNGKEAGSTQIVERAIDKIGKVLNSPEVRQRIASAIPASMRGRLTVDRALRAACQTILANAEEMSKCTPESIARAISEAALHGLICDGVTGQAYMVRFATTCVFMTGYRGKIALALRGANVATISGRTIFENDTFERFDLGTNDISGHRPHWMNGKAEPGRCLGYYAVATLKSGQRQVAVISYDDVQKLKEQIKRRNTKRDASGKVTREGTLSPAWTQSEHPMGEKTAVHRLGKYLDLEPDASNAFFRDDLLYTKSQDEELSEVEVPNPFPEAVAEPERAANGAKPKAHSPVEQKDDRPNEIPDEAWENVLHLFHDRGVLSEKQVARLFAIAHNHGWSSDEVEQIIVEKLERKANELPWGKPYDALVAIFEEYGPATTEAEPVGEESPPEDGGQEDADADLPF